MPEVENFYESAQRCFEVAKASGFLKPSDFLEEDIALEAFELLCRVSLGFGIALCQRACPHWVTASYTYDPDDKKAFPKIAVTRHTVIACCARTTSSQSCWGQTAGMPAV